MTVSRPSRPLLAGVALIVSLAAAGPAAARRASSDADFAPRFQPTVVATRAAGEIAIDGALNDAGWIGAGRADGFTEFAPRDLGRPDVATEALFSYDDEALYVAVICHDDPRTVRASLCERDRIWSDDYVVLMIDTYAAQSWAYEISANPHGIQGDLLLSANNEEDLGYDLVYHSAGRITDGGWQIEMAIPFASLRFPDRPQQTWRLNVWRNRPRASREQHTWAAIDRDDACMTCQWGTLTGVRDVQPGRGLELLPSLTARQEGARTATGDFAEGDILGEASLGLKYAPTSTFSAEGTINPDFSQVESDAAQIDANTTFALSYPEKRPFFLEGAEMYKTEFNAVYTRSVNDPAFAAKVIGRAGQTDVALLAAQDEHTPIILPFAEQSGFVAAARSWSNLLRIRHSLGDRSHVGLIATDRRYEGGGAATLGGVDGRLRVSRTTSVGAQILFTRTAEPDDPTLTEDLGDLTFDAGRRTAAFDGEMFNGHAVLACIEHATRTWGVDVDYWERSPGFRADAGFEPRNDQRQGEAGSWYVKRWSDGLVELVNPWVNLGRMWDFTNIRKDEWVVGGLGARLRRAQITATAVHMRSSELFGGVEFGGIWETRGQISAVPARWIEGVVEARTGHRIARRELVMGRERAAAAEVTLRPLDRLALETTWEWIQSFDACADTCLFKGYVARARVNLQLTRELSTRLVAQYDAFNETWEIDPLVTYRLSPFSIFYVGSTRDYARLAAGDEERRTWELAERTYFLKLQYLFRP